MSANRARPLSALMAEMPLLLSVHNRPAGGAGPGGDVHDVVLAPAGPRLLVADVKGHGPAAAPLADAVLAAFRDTAATEEDPVRLARTLDTRIRPGLGEEDFVTLLVADFVPNEVRLVNCGHPPPLRIDHRLTPLAPPQPSPPLGLGPDPRMQRAGLLPDQRLLFHTDGLTEARSPDGTHFPLDRRVFSALCAPDLDEALDQLLDMLHRHTGRTVPGDDLTVILVQPAPAARTATPDGGRRPRPQSSTP
ncbi:PP2C family protein-serine/threonine phosphatase [Streptomyces sclerotialus]|uniref:PP2C family protein-serine/threonine phosphatase n=1 Tax=Streptomyces sclerotialus TaxID=1957 RepID=UPI00068E298F